MLKDLNRERQTGKPISESLPKELTLLKDLNRALIFYCSRWPTSKGINLVKGFKQTATGQGAPENTLPKELTLLKDLNFVLICGVFSRALPKELTLLKDLNSLKKD